MIFKSEHNISFFKQNHFYIGMCTRFCEVAKKLTLPPKINEPIMKLYRC